MERQVDKGCEQARLWATGAQSQWGPSSVCNTPQNWPKEGQGSRGVYSPTLTPCWL